MDSNKLKKVAVGMSGGVDSSVAAFLLKEAGYAVTGVYMQCWDAKADGCRAEEDRADAVQVAAKLDLPFLSLDFVKEYKERVISHFYAEYRAGRTPNPDVLCNKEIKFGMFLDWALKEGFDFVATGHYARVKASQNTGDLVKYKLLKGLDDNKDQSYFLYLLGQEQLSKTLFPLGNMKKAEIREIAAQQGLHTALKPDSVGICFIGEVDIKEFLKKRIDMKVGTVVTSKGEVLGEHDGVWFYTIGQRHGFRINKYVGLPLYVIGKDVAKNELIVGFMGEVNRSEFLVENVHWIGAESNTPFRCDVRIRHLGELYPCAIVKGVGVGCLKVKLDDALFGVAPGQSAVFYLGDEVIGGGVIAEN